MVELYETLKYHAEKYREMMPVDVVKLLYLGEFGSEYIIKSPEKALEDLKHEYASVVHDPEGEVSEDIGEGLCRINLAPLDTSELSLEELNDIFVKSSREIKGDRENFIKKLKIFVMLTKLDLFSFDYDEAKAFVKAYIDEGMPPVRHSDRYRAAYHPAYRVIKAEYVSDFIEKHRKVIDIFSDD